MSEIKIIASEYYGISKKTLATLSDSEVHDMIELIEYHNSVI